MPPRCQVCTHPKVYVIHQALLTGRPIAQAARQFGLDRNAVTRHMRNHMTDAMREAAQSAQSEAGPVRIDVIEGEVLLGQAAEVYQLALATLEDLEKPGKDQRARVSALREVRACLETLAKLSFLIEDRGQGRIEKTTAPGIDAAITTALEERLGMVLDGAPSAARSEGPREPIALGPGIVVEEAP